jgi:HK97 family phage portal protein
MKIIRKLFNIKKKEFVQSQIIPLPQGSFLEYVFSDQQSISPNKAMSFYRSNSSISTAVDKIASACEQIQPVLRLPNSDIDTDHPSLLLLKAPNFFETYHEFIGQLARHYLLTREAYPALLGNINRDPSQIYAVKPQNVNIIPSSIDGYPFIFNISNIGPARGEYKREQEGFNIRYLNGNLQELYQIMGFSSRQNNIHGDSPLESISLEIKQQIYGKKHNISVLKNGGRLSLIISFAGDSTDEDEMRERKDQVRRNFGGADNAGGIATISGEEVKIQEVGKTNKDMDFINLDEISKNVIFLKYGVPLPLVSLDASTYNNIENAIFNFYENTVLPTYSVIMSGLTKVLLPRYNLDINAYQLTYNPESIPVIMRQKLVEMEKRKKINVETVNELRSAMGKDNIEKGGDDIYHPSSLVAIGSEEDIQPMTQEEIDNIIAANGITAE